jgi:hypothetical protein
MDMRENMEKLFQENIFLRKRLKHKNTKTLFSLQSIFENFCFFQRNCENFLKWIAN